MVDRPTDNSDETAIERMGRRAVPPDPRLVAAETARLSPLAVAGKVAGWVGAAALLVALFWVGITKQMTITPKVLLALGLVAVGFWVVTTITVVVQQVRARGFQAVLSSMLFTLFIIGIVVMINYIAGRHSIFRADWSEAKLGSLHAGSLEIVRSLDQDVTITAFVSPDYYAADHLRRLLREYEIHSSRVKLHMYDTKLALEKVEEYGRPYDGTVFVESGDRKEEVQGGTEEQISSAIMAVTTGQKTTVYFLTGHGELQVDAFGEQGLTVLKRYLENEQYEVKSLSLATEKEPRVPDDCAVLAIVGARQKPMEHEMKAISSYLSEGGNLWLALASPPAPDFAELLTPHGVRPLEGFVMDPARSLQGNPQVPAVLQPEGHDIVNGLTMVALPTVMAFEIDAPEPAMPGAPPPAGRPQVLLESTASAWLETSTSGPIGQDPDRRMGPLAMAVALDLSSASEPPPYPGAPEPPVDDSGGRIVAIGDFDFVRDDLYQAGLQSNVFLATSSIGWLARSERLITIPPHEPPDRTMVLATTQKNLAILISAVFIPVLVLLTGLFVWWRRR